MKLPLAYYGDPFLRKKTTPVISFDEHLKKLIDDMIETMKSTNGIGIAATQVFCSLSIFITASPYQTSEGEWETKPPKVFINPKILTISEKNWVHSEGCLSIPKIYAPVERPVEIVIKAQDIEGTVFEEVLTGWDARTFLHENDHINGVLFIDRLDKKERKKLEDSLRTIKKKYAKKD